MAGPEGSAGASLQQAEPKRVAMHAHCGAQPDWGQPALESETLPKAWEGLQEAQPLYDDTALAGAAPGGSTVVGSPALPSDTGPRAPLELRLLASEAAGMQQAPVDEEARESMPGKAKLTPVKTALLPALIN